MAAKYTANVKIVLLNIFFCNFARSSFFFISILRILYLFIFCAPNEISNVYFNKGVKYILIRFSVFRVRYNVIIQGAEATPLVGNTKIRKLFRARKIRIECIAVLLERYNHPHTILCRYVFISSSKSVVLYTRQRSHGNLCGNFDYFLNNLFFGAAHMRKMFKLEPKASK